MILKKFVFSELVSLALMTSVYGTDVHLSTASPHASPISSLFINDEDEGLFDQLGPSLKLMKLYMRDDFKSLPENLETDVRAFFSSKEYTPHDCHHVDMQEIEYDETLCRTICDLIRNEQRQAREGKVTLYHGLSGELFFAYRYLAEFFSNLTDSNKGEFVLRGDQFYARNPETNEDFKSMDEIQKFYKKKYPMHDGFYDSNGIGDYGRGINVKTIHCNIALSAGPNTSRTTASSVGFMCQSSSVRGCKIFDLICSSLVLHGMPLDDACRSATEVKNLYKEFFSNPNKKNGGILALSMSKKVADDLALHVEVGGKPYDLSNLELFFELKTFFDNKSVRYEEIQRYFLQNFVMVN
ncbi:MAG: hypothetical protein E7015_00685 [Alphaproteobacteria bacterium]|nr:hypothetical protein [Alphaproteobacteria bacterium]